MLLCAFWVCTGTARADCYSCFYMFKVELLMKDGSTRTGTTLTNNYESNLDAYIKRTQKLNFFDGLYHSQDQKWIKKERDPIEPFWFFAQDGRVDIDINEVASIKEIASSYEDGSLVSLPAPQVQRMTDTQPLFVHFFPGTDNEYIFIGRSEAFSETLMKDIDSVLKKREEDESMPIREILQKKSDTKDMKPQESIVFSIYESGC